MLPFGSKVHVPTLETLQQKNNNKMVDAHIEARESVIFIWRTLLGALDDDGEDEGLAAALCTRPMRGSSRCARSQRAAGRAYGKNPTVVVVRGGHEIAQSDVTSTLL